MKLLKKDLNSIPSTHVVTETTSYSSSKRSDTFFGFMQYINIYVYNSVIHIKFKK